MYIPSQYKALFKFLNKLLVVFKFANKYLYILSFISIVSSIFARFSNNKFYLTINWIIKIILIINIIVGVGYILYFSAFEQGNPIDNLFSLYNELYELYVKPYIESLINFWKDLNLKIEDSYALKESNIDITIQIKKAIKEGVKEAVEELVGDFNTQANLGPDYNSALLKSLALVTSTLLFSYFLFYLPGSINPEELAQYNWVNQSLIECKISVKDYILSFFSNPGNPGSPSIPNTGIIESPVTPIIDQLNTYIPISPSIFSEGLSTVTPNTPIVPTVTPNSPIVPTLSSYVEASAQSELTGFMVGRMHQTVNILGEVLNHEAANIITNAVNQTVINITD